LKKAVDQLPEQVREPLVLCFFAGIRQQELADHFACTQSTVAYRLDKGLALLRKSLARAGYASALPLLETPAALFGDARWKDRVDAALSDRLREIPSREPAASSVRAAGAAVGRPAGRGAARGGRRRRAGHRGPMGRARSGGGSRNASGPGPRSNAWRSSPLDL
jgi:hypothetical protein